MSSRRTRQRGQVLIMVSIALVAMLGILGLAVDFGWAFFIRRSAQAAADTAALTAVQAALDSGQLTPSGITPCPAAGALTNGCLYAARNGFSNDASTRVTMEAGTGAFNGIPAIYWVTARIQQDVPQLFSAVLGRTTGVSGARATAAIMDTPIQGALILLNRERDCVAMAGPNSAVCGVNLHANGSSWIRAKDGILMSSTRRGEDLGLYRDGSQWAGELGGSGRVEADFTAIRGKGAADVAGIDTFGPAPAPPPDPAWDEPWRNNWSDSDYFKDPMRLLGHQPSRPPSSMPVNPAPVSGGTTSVTGCVIQGGTSAANALKLQPGKYYSVAGNGCRDGDPIEVRGYVEFLAGAASSGNAGTECSGGTCFGNYVFFGGLKTTTSTHITFDPGRYVFAGTTVQGGQPRPSFDVTSGQVTLTDRTPLDPVTGNAAPNTDGGELFLFTDTHYRDEYGALDTSGVPATVLSQLTFGSAGFQAGNNNQVLINLHGLNKTGGIPETLKEFNSVALWQDQHNSVVRYYKADGKMDYGCITGPTTASCTQTPAYSQAPKLDIQASPNVDIYGIIYQPRGSWTSLGGGSQYAGPMRLITGAIDFSGGADLTLTTLGSQIVVHTVALIE